MKTISKKSIVVLSVVAVLVLAAVVLFVIPFPHPGYYSAGHGGEYLYWHSSFWAPLVH